jgi:hypothetical protein
LTHRVPCYASELYTGDEQPPRSLRAPRDGQRVTVSLRVAGQAMDVRRVRLHRVTQRTLANNRRLGRQTAKIGCPAGGA